MSFRETMQNPAHTPQAEQLLEQRAWIQRLARSLVGDAHRADDLVQETWVRALEHPPGADGPIRGWVATVMRNLASQGRRGDGRRAAREQAAAREERVETADEVVERATVHQTLVEVVMALDEPYRTTVLLRYFDGLAPSDIARRTQTPLATVKSRLVRGLELLRERLDRRSGGDRSAWLSALVPLLSRPELGVPIPTAPAAQAAALPLASLASVGALLMNVKILGAVAVLATAGIAFLVARRPDAAQPVVVAADDASELPDTSPMAKVPAPDFHPDAVPSQRTPAAASVEVAKQATRSAPERAAPAAFVARGRVIDVRSLPVGGVTVRQVAGAHRRERELELERQPEATLAETLTDGAGTFELATQPGGTLVVDDERYCTVLAASVVEQGAVVVVAPSIELSGRVIDDAGRPLAGARVEVAKPRALRSELEAILDTSHDVAFAAVTDEQGLFRIDEAPAIAGARLLAGKAGYAPLDDPAPEQSLFGLTIVLETPDAGARILRGQVVDKAGRPAPDTRVGYGIDTTVTDERGLFAFDLDAETTFNRKWNELAARHMGKEAVLPPPDTLLAVKTGYMPVVARANGRDERGDALWPAHVVIRLEREPLAIEGRVVDVDGTPLGGIQIWIADPTLLGHVGDPSAGRGRTVYTEALLAGSDEEWHRITTGDDGRFELAGLLDRDYTLQAMDPMTLLRAQVDRAPAGRPIEITLPTDQLYTRLRGRVVSHAGRPVPNVRIHPMNDAFQYKNAGVVTGTRHAVPPKDPVVTDENGFFELTDVPRHLAYLRLDGEDTIPLEWGRRIEGGLEELVGEDPDTVVIEVSVRCHFQVELEDAERADEIMVLGPDGKAIEISEFLGNGRRDGPRAGLIDGLSPTLAVGDEARTLVLFRETVEVGRIEIELNPDEKTTLRP